MLVSKTFETITGESAANGEFEETGFVYQDLEMTLEEVVDEIDREGFCEWSSYPNPVPGDWLSTVSPENTLDYIEKGIAVYYNLHISGATEKEWEHIVAYTKY